MEGNNSNTVKKALEVIEKNTERLKDGGATSHGVLNVFTWLGYPKKILWLKGVLRNWLVCSEKMVHGSQEMVKDSQFPQQSMHSKY